MILIYFPRDNSWRGYSILFDRITTMKVYFSEITLPSYSNSSSKAHLYDYWAKYGCISAFSIPYTPFKPRHWTPGILGGLNSHTRIKYTQKHLNLRRGKRDFILYFQLKKITWGYFLFFYALKMSLARGILFFLSFIWERGRSSRPIY